MLLSEDLLNKLIPILKKHSPVRTGNLRDNGIQGVLNIVPGKIAMIQIGYPATPGYPATEDYAAYTQTRNRSKGWVNRAIKEWADTYRDQILNFLEAGVDEDVL